MAYILSKDINHGEELTLNYSFIVSDNDFEEFLDCETNKTVYGLNDKDFIKQSIKTINRILGNTY